MKAARGHAVLRISCLPKYFTEREIAGYLKQFGDIGSIFMPRSPKVRCDLSSYLLTDVEMQRLCFR